MCETCLINEKIEIMTVISQSSIRLSLSALAIMRTDLGGKLNLRIVKNIIVLILEMNSQFPLFDLQKSSPIVRNVIWKYII